MPDGIQARMDLRSEQVTLSCGDEAFARLWAVVAEVAPVAATPAGVRVIVIERVPPPGAASAGEGGLKPSPAACSGWRCCPRSCSRSAWGLA